MKDERIEKDDFYDALGELITEYFKITDEILTSGKDSFEIECELITVQGAIAMIFKPLIEAYEKNKRERKE